MARGIYTTRHMEPTSPKAHLLERLSQKLSSSSKRVYSSRDLAALFDELRTEWNLPKNLTRSKFQKLVIENGTLEEIRLTATYPFDSKRFHHGPFTNYELALSLRPDSYLSHGSAAFLHGLTDQEPEFIYVNKEQSPKNRSGPLSQAGINRALSNKQRQSTFIVTHAKTRIMLLSGKDSGRLGVKQTKGSQGETLDVTNIERTLIDIAVRPEYAGGVRNVLQCYVRTNKTLSVERVSGMLADLEYLYPYHQAIGFFLKCAGYHSSALRVLREPKLRFDFFLAHAMKKTKYDKEWRITYPADFE